jgi:hypothetical protein
MLAYMYVVLVRATSGMHHCIEAQLVVVCDVFCLMALSTTPTVSVPPYVRDDPP